MGDWYAEGLKTEILRCLNGDVPTSLLSNDAREEHGGFLMTVKKVKTKIMTSDQS